MRQIIFFNWLALAYVIVRIYFLLVKSLSIFYDALIRSIVSYSTLNIPRLLRTCSVQIHFYCFSCVLGSLAPAHQLISELIIFFVYSTKFLFNFGYVSIYYVRGNIILKLYLKIDNWLFCSWCLNSYFIRCILINQLRINYWIIFARSVIFNLFLWIIVKISKLISLPAHLSLHRWKYKRINLFFTFLLLHIRAIICKI